MRIQWRFAEQEDDGAAWLRHPSDLVAYVDYANASGEWRRVMVVTKTWLEKHLRGVRVGGDGAPLWAAIPTLIVLPDVSGEDLRRTVDRVLQEGGLDSYATPVGS